MFKFHYQNEKKRKSVKKFSVLQNGAIRGLQIGAGVRDYKLRQKELQIGTALGISNWVKKITNWDKEILNRGRDYKSGQEGFQAGAGITNWCRAYGVSLSSILGLLLFLLCVNNIYFASDLLDPIMFAYDNNLFYSSKSV